MLPHSLRNFLPILLLIVFSCSSDTTLQEAESISLPGLKDEVEILRDQWGVNHIYAQNEHDLFFAQGYAAARDRLFQFEVWRMRATGTVSEVLGPEELQRDISARLFRYRGDLQEDLKMYHPRGDVIISAYVEGVNARINEVLQDPDLLPAEFAILGITPKKWTPEVVISRHQGLRMNVRQELDLGIAVHRVGAEKVKEIMWFHPGDPEIQLDDQIDGSLLHRDILALYRANGSDLRFQPHHVNLPATDSAKWSDLLGWSSGQVNPDARWLDGSNNWVVAGHKTSSGHAVMANDPHRSITIPSLRYMVHLVAPGWNVIGGGEPVIPGVSIGHNEHGAWGLTIHQTDSEDLFVYDLNPDNLSQYRYKNQWVSMEEMSEVISVKDSSDHTATLRYTVHGPVTWIDSANHVAYAVGAGWLEPGGAPYLASLRMDQATSWEEFREACSYSHLPGENMVWADREGNIGWQTVGIFPRRNQASGLVPVPGDGRYDWDGYVPILDRPHVLNPEQGFLATANQHVTPSDYEDDIGFIWSDPFRGDRINEVLAQDKKFSLEDMQALQTDYFSLAARELVPLLDGITLSGATRQAKNRLQSWNFTLDLRSVEAGIYVMWENHLMAEAERQFVPEELKDLSGINLQLSKLIHQIRASGPWFGSDAKTHRDAFLKSCFESAIAELQERFGNSMDAWVYGQPDYKHIALNNPVPGLLDSGVHSKTVLGPLPRGGNGYTPNATSNNDNQSHGATFRMITDVGDWDGTLMINSPGQSADPTSPYYSNLFQLWDEDGYFPAYYSREKIEEVTTERLFLNGN